MASRLVFTPTESYPWFKENLVHFEWVPGLARTQAQKSIRNLHKAARDELNAQKILEVSTKSEEILGQKLSAFNLKISQGERIFSLESTYQASKVFEKSIQFVDLLEKEPIDAKQDPRLKSSGKLTGFRFENRSFNLVSSPNFYDYLYVLALLQSGLENDVLEYEGFTDHAFSGDGRIVKGRSVNCQARSLAIYVGISGRRTHREIIEQLLIEANRGLSHEQADLFEI